jgi:ketosteroid isomerase-like protein
VIAQGTQSKNVAIVDRLLALLEGYLQGDRDPWTSAIPELLTADVEILPSSALFSGTPDPYIGHAGAERWLADVMAEWRGAHTHILELIDLPPDRVASLGVVVCDRESDRGYASLVGSLSTVRDGKVARLQAFSSHAETLRAAGLTTRG